MYQLILSVFTGLFPTHYIYLSTYIDYLLVFDKCALAADVDAIQELTNILVLHEAYLVDKRCRTGDQLNVISTEHELVLNILRALA